MEPRPVTSASPRVGLFVTCLVDLFGPDRLRHGEAPGGGWVRRRRPARADLLRAAGVQFRGYESRRAARQAIIAAFSGSTMWLHPRLMRRHAPDPLPRAVRDRPAMATVPWHWRRCHELLSFLADVRDIAKGRAPRR